MFSHTHTHTHTHRRTHIYIHTHTHRRTHIYIHTHIYIYVCVHTYTHTHIYIHTHTHTHTRIRWRFIYSPVPSASAPLLTLHNYSLITGPCSFISHLISQGSTQPGSHKFWLTWLITHASLLGPTRYPLSLLGRKGARMGKGLAQEHTGNSNFGPVVDQARDLSLASRACYHWATTPHA